MIGVIKKKKQEQVKARQIFTNKLAKILEAVSC